MKSLETFMWALTTKNEAVLAESCTRGADGQPTRLTGLSSDFSESVAGVQVLAFSAHKPDAEQWRCALIAEIPAAMEGPNGPFESVSHVVLNLRFKRENGIWQFDGRAS